MNMVNFEKITKRNHLSDELPERRQRNNKLNKPRRFGKLWRNYYDRNLRRLLLERERQQMKYAARRERMKADEF